jgi:hypothetical protein
MLSLPTKSFRVRAAVALAAFYAFCILLPATAFALADGRMAPPCLMEDLAASPLHDHAMLAEVPAGHHHGSASHTDAGMAHHRGDGGHTAGAAPRNDPDHGKSRPGECCGLFPMVALAGELRPAPTPSGLTSTIILLLTDALTGRGPDRIIRPPIP